MARTAKITNANVAPRKNAAGLVGNTPVRAQDFNDLAGDYVSLTDANAQSIAGAVTAASTLGVTGVATATGGLVLGSETVSTDSAACSITVPVTILDHDGDEGVTLANGTAVGQVKIFVSSTNNTVTLTPATTSGAYATIATTDIGANYMLMWTADGWAIISMASGATGNNANAVASYPDLA